MAKRDIILWRNNTLYFPPRIRSYQRLEGHQYDFTFFSVTVSKKKTLFMHLYKSRSRRRQFITMKSRSDEPEVYETYTNKHILYLRDSLYKKLTLSIILLNWKNLEKNIYHRLNYCITKRTRYTQDIFYISIVLFDSFDLKWKTASILNNHISDIFKDIYIIRANRDLTRTKKKIVDHYRRLVGSQGCGERNCPRDMSYAARASPTRVNEALSWHSTESDTRWFISMQIIIIQIIIARGTFCRNGSTRTYAVSHILERRGNQWNKIPRNIWYKNIDLCDYFSAYIYYINLEL